jgi:hypothetical protein
MPEHCSSTAIKKKKRTSLRLCKEKGKAQSKLTLPKLVTYAYNQSQDIWPVAHAKKFLL